MMASDATNREFMSWLNAVSHMTPMKDKNITGVRYLFSQTVPQILLLAKESHSIRLSYIRIALLSCFCKLMHHTQ